jgi:hypothetical protein
MHPATRFHHHVDCHEEDRKLRKSMKREPKIEIVTVKVKDGSSRRSGFRKKMRRTKSQRRREKHGK